MGFRNYPAFIHFVSAAMLLSIYMSAVGIGIVIHLVKDPFTADPNTSPLHALFIALTGAVFALSLGSFTFYHFYLITTNQTTLEHISPFRVLRYLPPPKPHVPPLPSAVSSRPSLRIASEFTIPSKSLDSPLSFDGIDPIESLNENDIRLQRLDSHTKNSPELIPHPSLPTPPYKPPEEYELSSAQRRFVLRTHGKIRMYDLGWKKNWAEVFGGEAAGKEDGDFIWGSRVKWRGKKLLWLKLLLTGGHQKGNGWDFEKTPNIDAKLQRFAKVLREITEEESR